MTIYTHEMCAALLYPLGPTYNLGTWGYTEGMRRLAAARELSSGRQQIYGVKNQISNLAFIYTFAGILLCDIKPNVFLYMKSHSFTLFLKFRRFVT